MKKGMKVEDNGTVAAPPPLLDGSYFARRYFAARYWGKRYFN